MKSIPRLTQAMVTRAERGGKVRGWYQLCRMGYLPEEIHVYSASAWPFSEVRFKVRQYAADGGLPIPANCATKRVRMPKELADIDPATAFRQTVMRTGLALVLTQPMLEELCAIASGVLSNRSLYFQVLGRAQPSNSIATRAALQNRGLIDCKGTLTLIGKKVTDLLHTAGVFVEPDAALEKRAAT